MITINRGDIPDVLKQGENPKSKGELETIDALKFFSDQNNHKSTYRKVGTTTVGYKIYSDNSVRDVLLDMFHGKCAYCESKITSIYNGDIEHFRPKGEIKEATPTKPGYYWLAAEWENLLFACPFCNQTNTHTIISNGILKETVLGKLHQFPLVSEQYRLKYTHGQIYFSDRNTYKQAFDLEETERLLLNPCKDSNIENYFEYKDSGVIIVNGNLTEPIDIFRAEKSIQVYALNRLALVQARREKIIQIKAQIKRTEESIINYNRYAKQSDEEKIWFEGIMRKEMKILKRYKNINQEYSGLAKCIIRKYFEEIYFT